MSVNLGMKVCNFVRGVVISDFSDYNIFVSEKVDNIDELVNKLKNINVNDNYLQIGLFWKNVYRPCDDECKTDPYFVVFGEEVIKFEIEKDDYYIRIKTIPNEDYDDILIFYPKLAEKPPIITELISLLQERKMTIKEYIKKVASYLHKLVSDSLQQFLTYVNSHLVINNNLVTLYHNSTSYTVSVRFDVEHIEKASSIEEVFKEFRRPVREVTIMRNNKEIVKLIDDYDSIHASIYMPRYDKYMTIVIPTDYYRRVVLPGRGPGPAIVNEYLSDLLTEKIKPEEYLARLVRYLDNTVNQALQQYE